MSRSDQEVYTRQVLLSGRVQGVGLRYTVRRIATGFEVTGQVRNLADGRVQLEAEGEENEVDAFIAAVEESFSDHIRQKEETTTRGARRFRDFGIG